MEGRAEPRPVASDSLLAGEILAQLETLSETRVRGFDFSEETRTEPLPFLSSTSRQTSSTFSCGIALDLCGFLQEDPIDLLVDPSLYAYVGNGPLVFGDPSGLIRVNCSVCDLAAGKKNAERRLMLLRTTGSDRAPGEVPSGGSVTTCMGFSFDPVGARSGRNAGGKGITINFDRFDDAPCSFLCRQAHEARHRQDCQSKGANYYRLTIPQREIPGYEEELKCYDTALASGHLDVGGMKVTY